MEQFQSPLSRDELIRWIASRTCDSDDGIQSHFEGATFILNRRSGMLNSWAPTLSGTVSEDPAGGSRLSYHVAWPSIYRSGLGFVGDAFATLFVIVWSTVFLFQALPSAEVPWDTKLMAFGVWIFVGGTPWIFHFLSRKDGEVLRSFVTSCPQQKDRA